MSEALPISFSNFVVSLASSAMVHLGEYPDPTSGQTEIHLGLARHSIDVLGLLKDKTKGNLDEEETKLLDALLYELRTKFVAVSKSQGAPAVGEEAETTEASALDEE